LPLGSIENYTKKRLKKGDYLFIVSADINYVLSDNFIPDRKLLNWISDLHKNDIAINAICNGAFLLGKTGLLDGLKCTTHWKRTKALQKQFPLAKVQENILFIEDKGIITSAGATSGVDVALYIITQLKDDLLAHKISRELIIYNRRSGNDTQHSVYLNNRNHVHIGIHKVQDYLQENIHKKKSLHQLAEIANMSYRNFCRVFKKETSLTVTEYMNILRIEKITQLSKNADITKIQMANACGLMSERHLNRVIKMKNN
jgi:transcriptional regulator GlxA family with amidase domain